MSPISSSSPVPTTMPVPRQLSLDIKRATGVTENGSQQQPYTGPNYLESIVFDVLLQIVENLDVISTVHLTMVSKYMMENLANSRIVWIHILQRTIHDQCLMPHTFPIATMTARELERCATRPLRLHHEVKTSQLSSPTSRTLRFDFGSVSTPEDPWSEAADQDPYLLPGGRWLLNFAISKTDIHICCWDLQLKAGAEHKGHDILRPVATIRLSKPYGKGTSVAPRFAVQSDFANHRAAILASYEGKALVVFEVVHLTFSTAPDTAPKFSFVNSIDAEADVSSGKLSMEGHLVVIPLSVPDLLVWNWHDGTWAVMAAWRDVMWWLQPPYIYTLADDFGRTSAYLIPPLTRQTDPPSVLPISAHAFRFQLSGKAAKTAVGIYESIPLFHSWKPASERITTLQGATIALANDSGGYDPETLLLESPTVSRRPGAIPPRIWHEAKEPGADEYKRRRFTLTDNHPDLSLSVDEAVSISAAGKTSYLNMQVLLQSSHMATPLKLALVGLNAEEWLCSCTGVEASAGKLCGEPCPFSGNHVLRNVKHEYLHEPLYSVQTFD